MKYVKSLISHYDFEVEYYSDSWIEKWHLDMELKVIKKILERILNKKNHKKGLDIACHTGRYSLLLRKIGLDVLGIDTSEKALNVARKNTANIKNLRFKNSDATKLNLNEKFDVIILMEILHHLKDKEAKKLFKKAISLLNGGGLLLFDVKNINNPVIRHIYKKYSSNEVLLIARKMSFFEKIAKDMGCEFIVKKSLVTPFWRIEPFVIVALRKPE